MFPAAVMVLTPGRLFPFSAWWCASVGGVIDTFNFNTVRAHRVPEGTAYFCPLTNKSFLAQQLLLPGDDTTSNGNKSLGLDVLKKLGAIRNPGQDP